MAYFHPTNIFYGETMKNLECSSNWFVLHEILGKKDVQIYDGSLHQWTQYEASPMTRELTR